MPNLTRLEKRKRKLRELPEHKSKSDNELSVIAQASLDAGEPAIPGSDQLDIAVKFRNKSERKMAQDLLERYLQDYAIETVSEKNTLQEVIYLEVVQLRLQEKLNELYEADTKAMPFNIIELIHKNSDAIVRLKNTLGLNKSKDKLTAYDAFDHLKKRFRKWREENQGARTLKCPHCEKFVLLKIRTDAWEAQKHPFFKDNTLYNKALFSKLGQTIEITKDFVASILEVSKDYVDWMVVKSRQTGEQNIQTGDSNSNGEKETSGQEKEKVEIQVTQTIEAKIEVSNEHAIANENSNQA